MSFGLSDEPLFPSVAGDTNSDHRASPHWGHCRRRRPLERLLELAPDSTGPDNAYELLARVHRELGEAAAERAVLERYAAIDADALPAYRRLLELQSADRDWQAAMKTARRVLAVQPLIAQPYRVLLQAAGELGQQQTAIAACRTLLNLQPDNPATVHFQLARLLHDQKDPAAKRHLLLALEEAPRFRAAYELLLEMKRPAE